MTRRPVQQARRITDKQLVSWPVREPIDWPPIRASWREMAWFAAMTVAMSICILAIGLGLAVFMAVAS